MTIISGSLLSRNKFRLLFLFTDLLLSTSIAYRFKACLWLSGLAVNLPQSDTTKVSQVFYLTPLLRACRVVLLSS